MRGISAALCVAAVSLGCSHGDGPSGLLNVVDFAPREAEVGDRLEVLGSGFPEGKPATLSFRGDLYRPGQDPERGVEIVANAASTSQNRISLLLSEHLQGEFCGRGERADHTTFRGDVVAAFASRTAGAPPVTGTVQNVVLDIHGPAVPTEVVKEREAEGARALAFVGIEIDKDIGKGPISVAKVVPGSRAQRAGMVDGDVLVSVDGVDVSAPSDVAFAGTRRLSHVQVRRGKLREPVELAIDVQGFRRAAPGELGTIGVLVGIVVFLFLWWMLPTARVASWIERRVALRLRDRAEKREKSRGFFAGIERSLSREMAPADEPVVFRLIPYLAFLATSAGATFIAFGRPLVSVDLDLGLIVVGMVTALVSVSLMTGGWRSEGRWSLIRGFRYALATLALEIPLVLALGSVVLASGSVRLVDIVARQGALPWTWNAFKSPASFVAFVLVIAASFPEVERQRAELADADLDPAPPSGLMFYVGWCHLLVVSTLAAFLFLGGFRVPPQPLGISPNWWLGLGALVLQVKCWAVAGLVVFLRWALPRVRVDQMGSIFWRWLLPVSMVALIGSFAWTTWQRSPVIRSAEPIFGYVLCGLSAFGLVKFTRSVWALVHAPNAPMHVNPWL